MNCRIIKDLLPMYVEQLTSDPSNDLIQEHIKTCQDCSWTLAGLKNDVIIASPSQADSPADAVPLQLVKRIKTRILEKIIVLASVAFVGGMLIGILSSSPLRVMVLMASTSLMVFAVAILLSIAVCRRTSPRKRFQMVGNWTIVFSLIVSGLLFVLFRGLFNEFAKMAAILVPVIIYNIVFSVTLRVYARTKLPKDAEEEPTNRRLYLVAFCTVLGLTALVAVPVKK